MLFTPRSLLEWLVGRPRASQDFLQLGQRRSTDCTTRTSQHDEPKWPVQLGQLFVGQAPGHFFRQPQSRDSHLLLAGITGGAFLRP